MEPQLILLIFLFLCPPLVHSEAQQGRWKTDSLKDKLVFGRPGRRAGSSARKRNLEFAGGKTRRQRGGDREGFMSIWRANVTFIMQISVKIFKLKEKCELKEVKIKIIHKLSVFDLKFYLSLYFEFYIPIFTFKSSN